MQDWDDLRFFNAIANSGSVTAASEKLGVNQSTVSRRINNFEKKINVRLFDRLSTGYVLTQEGIELKKYVDRIEEESLAIDRHIMGKNIALDGPIRVTTSLVMYRYALLPLIQKFINLHPNIELRFDFSNNLYNISQREADVAIRVTRDPLPENLIARELGFMNFGVYGAISYLQAFLKKKKNLVLHWIGEDNDVLRPDWLPEKYKKLKLVMRSNDVIATTDAIKNNMGVGRLPHFIGHSEKTLQKMEHNVQTKGAPIFLLTHVDMRRVNRVKVFNDFMVDELRNYFRHNY